MTQQFQDTECLANKPAKIRKYTNKITLTTHFLKTSDITRVALVGRLTRETIAVWRNQKGGSIFQRKSGGAQ